MSRFVFDFASKEAVKTVVIGATKTAAPVLAEAAGAVAEAYDNSLLGRVHRGMGDFEGMSENPNNPLQRMPHGVVTTRTVPQLSAAEIQHQEELTSSSS